METISTSILIFLFLVAFNNYRKGTLKAWLKAKFLNSATPNQQSGTAFTTSSASASSSTSSGKTTSA